MQAALLASLVVSPSATSEVWRVRNGDSHEENTAEDWLVPYPNYYDHDWEYGIIVQQFTIMIGYIHIYIYIQQWPYIGISSSGMVSVTAEALNSWIVLGSRSLQEWGCIAR